MWIYINIYINIYIYIYAFLQNASFAESANVRTTNGAWFALNALSTYVIYGWARE